MGPLPDLRLLWRLTALGLATVLVQIAAVSQLKIFGANADLTPLIVASAGLLAGSLPGAVFGFGVGLFLDLALVQTVGLSSLLFLIIGFGAGRLRELRDPQNAVVPSGVFCTRRSIRMRCTSLRHSSKRRCVQRRGSRM